MPKKSAAARKSAPKTPPPPASKPLSPIINIAIFRRDVYFLSALLLADKKIAEIDRIKDAANAHFDNEVNRLLVLISVSARQLIDIAEKSAPIPGKIGNSPCGKYWEKFPESASVPLYFRKSCNAIIHAEDITPYSAKKSGDPGRAVYKGKIAIRGVMKNNNNNTRAELNGEEFVKCCIMLSDHFLEN